MSFLGLKGGIKGVKGAKIKQNTEALQKAEVETKPASEVKPAEEVQNIAPKYSPEEIAAFNESKGVTSAKIEHRYTGKTSQTVENGYERSISGEPGFETETFINPRAKDRYFGDGFSKYEYKYTDGRRTQRDIYNEWGKPAYRDFFEYNSDGRLVKVKEAEFDPFAEKFKKPETVHSFEYDNKGMLLKAEHPFMGETVEYEYSPEGKLVREIQIGKYVENQVKTVKTYKDNGDFTISQESPRNQKIQIKTYNSKGNFLFSEFVDK